jgi:biopolymer transport protein ExbB
MQLFAHVTDMLLQGGWVMIPLSATSLLMWALIIDRLLLYRRLDWKDLSLDEASRAIRERILPQTGGVRAQLVCHFFQRRGKRSEVNQAVLHCCADELRRGYERRLSLIETLAAIAPLLGLLGTVLGMIETFQIISLFGTGNPRAMASGISVAMITTQMGLLVAVPGLFMAGRLRVVVIERELVVCAGEVQ